MLFQISALEEKRNILIDEVNMRFFIDDILSALVNIHNYKSSLLIHPPFKYRLYSEKALSKKALSKKALSEKALSKKAPSNTKAPYTKRRP